MKHLLTALPLLLIPSVALAHPGHGYGLEAGFLHPFTGTDHLLAMIGVGLWAAILGGRARWALPAGFLSAMALGGAFAMNLGLGAVAQAVEPAIIASVILLGAVVALALRAPLALALPLVGLFGLAHGAAHGTEMVGNGMAFGAAMLTATALLHGAGLAWGLTLNGKIARALGGVTALAGLALAFA
ncbi:MAG: urease accessory protein [Cypionkella sp.]|uniref:HupE/UreJ family protein n=1 Tax=Cypionkella sp. TaxID=2811411 RepID=UPI002617CF7E|nr:HupE/UreJ family protein [Cypionkella sp.]MDB5659786.1 urease accessory protein [Cypionkella sp.]